MSRMQKMLYRFVACGLIGSTLHAAPPTEVLPRIYQKTTTVRIASPIIDRTIAPAGDLCVLTRIAGLFDGYNQFRLTGITDYRSPGPWRIIGNAPQGDIEVQTTCYSGQVFVPSSPLKAGRPIYDTALSYKMPNECYSNEWTRDNGLGWMWFLSAVGGRFSGAGEHVRIDGYGGDGVTVHLDGCQGSLSAQAFGIKISDHQTRYWKDGKIALGGIIAARYTSNGPPVRMGPSGLTICFLTGMQGKFRGDGEWVQVASENGAWVLRTGSKQGGAVAEAACILRKQE